MGAVQAQDYLGSLWAVGLRVAGALESDVEDAIAARSIVRTWPMRGTLHFVAAQDVRWMISLLTPRVIARSAGRYRELGLGEPDFRRARRVLTRALRGGRQLTRREAYDALEREGIPAAGQRGIHVLAHLAQQGLLCFGPRRGRQPTFVLLDEWVPPTRVPAREDALAALATRYFTSHGPATLHDFSWWSGLRVADAAAALDAAGPALVHEVRGGRRWWSAPGSLAARWRPPVAALLPPWDDYVVAYRDRAGALDPLARGGGVPAPLGRSLIVIDGRVRGSWRRTLGAARVRVDLEPWDRLGAGERRAVEAGAARYARFLGKELLR